MAVHNVVGARGWAMYCKAMNVGYKCVAAWNEPWRKGEQPSWGAYKLKRAVLALALSVEYIGYLSSTMSIFSQLVALAFCILPSYARVTPEGCLPAGHYLFTHKEPAPHTPLDVADPAVKAVDLAVTPEGKYSIKFILYDDTNALGFFSAPYTFEDEVHLVLYGVEGVPPFYADRLGKFTTDDTFRTLTHFDLVDNLVMSWDGGVTRFQGEHFP
ncbi:hypothetical protein FOZ63_022737 [Perkinsus olseni]|uniref:Uncharacterized protein n=1 Tax=Perkinsus olseni TaxID=32597 RepID=A0A7J6Q1F8_PEROL|nr:hypothetical protein FOZ63_022737 [Perkinsus olseni]